MQSDDSRGSRSRNAYNHFGAPAPSSYRCSISSCFVVINFAQSKSQVIAIFSPSVFPTTHSHTLRLFASASFNGADTHVNPRAGREYSYTKRHRTSVRKMATWGQGRILSEGNLGPLRW
jgi:hypothetical protein